MTSTTGQSSRRIWLLLALCLLLTGTAAAQSPGPGESLMARAERVLAWLYDIPFDPPRRRQLRQAMTADWQSSPPEKNAQLDPQLTALERMMTAPPLEQEVVRQKLGLDLLEQARAQPRKQLHGFVLATHAAVHPPLAPGPPALTAQVSDGFMQLLGFAFAEVKGTPHGETPAETLEAGRKALASRWAQISTAERQKIALSPLYLAAMRFKWPKLPAAEKERWRAGWRQKLAPALAQTGKDNEKEKAQPSAAAPAAVQTPPKAAPATGKGNAPAQDAKAQAKAMMNVQTQMMMNQMRSNMMRDMHITSMNIIQNIGSGPKYEWKWVPYP